MAIAFDAFAGSTASSVSSLTYSLTVGAGANRSLVVNVVGDTADLITGVTFNGVATTLVDKFAADGLWHYLFYLNAPASGAHNVVVTASGTSAFILSCAASHTGVKQTGQPEASSKSSLALSATITETVTTVTDNAWTVMGGKTSAGNPTAGTGSTFRGNDGFSSGLGIGAIFDSNGVVHPAAAHSMTFTQDGGGSPISGIIVSLAPATVTALSNGTASLTTATDTTLTLDGGTASGGSTPYTYQWYRSATGNFTPGAGNILSGATSATVADSTGLSADTPYFYIRRVTDALAATADSNQVAGILKAAPLKIYCLGDSLTNGTSGPAPAADTPPQLLATTLAKVYKPRAVTCTNGGLNGKSAQNFAADTGGILTAAVSAAQAASATLCSIMLGANDAIAGRTAAQYKADLQTIAAAFVAVGINVTVHYPTYIPAGANGGATTAAATELTRQYLAKIDELANGTTYRQGDQVAYAYFADNPSETQSDQTHLLEAGVQSLAVMWARAIDRNVVQVTTGVAGSRIFTGF